SPCIDAGDSTALLPDRLDVDGDGDTSEPMPLDLHHLPRRGDVPGGPATGGSGRRRWSTWAPSSGRAERGVPETGSAEAAGPGPQSCGNSPDGTGRGVTLPARETKSPGIQRGAPARFARATGARGGGV